MASGKGGELLAAENSTIREPVESRRYEDLVAAHSAAVATLSREIADRMAISESDFYRKQRMAIAHLAKTLTAMELEESESPS